MCFKRSYAVMYRVILPDEFCKKSYNCNMYMYRNSNSHLLRQSNDLIKTNLNVKEHFQMVAFLSLYYPSWMLMIPPSLPNKLFLWKFLNHFILHNTSLSVLELSNCYRCYATYLIYLISKITQFLALLHLSWNKGKFP